MVQEETNSVLKFCESLLFNGGKSIFCGPESNGLATCLGTDTSLSVAAGGFEATWRYYCLLAIAQGPSLEFAPALCMLSTYG